MTVEQIAAAILMWFAAQNGGSWVECGKRYTPKEAGARSQYYATIIHDLTKNGSTISGVEETGPILGIIAAESGFDSCQVGAVARKAMGLTRKPSKEQVLSAVRQNKVQKADFGLAQFRLPLNISQVRRALDPKTNLNRLIGKMPEHQRLCVEKYPEGVLHKSGRLTCDDIYWVLHCNGRDFIPRYYQSVLRQMSRMRI